MKKLDIGKILKIGDKGPGVEMLQIMLGDVRARPKLKIDGAFGPKTKQAVKHFQKLHTLSQDGVVGKKTATALNAVIRLPKRKRPEMLVEDWNRRRQKYAKQFQAMKKNIFADFVHARDVQNDGSRELAKILKVWDNVYKNFCKDLPAWESQSKQVAKLQSDFDTMTLKGRLMRATTINNTVTKLDVKLHALEKELWRLAKKSDSLMKVKDKHLSNKM